MADNKKPCKKCANYETVACMGEIARRMWIDDYGYDCFTTEEEKFLCELMCGGIEEED
jgi:hypothetical protein